MEEVTIDETVEAVMNDEEIDAAVDAFGIGVKIVGMILIGVGSILVYKGLTGK